MRRILHYAAAVALWLVAQFADRARTARFFLRWRLWRFGVLLPVGGGALETTTTLATALKEFYPGGGIVDQVNTDTYWLDKMAKAKKFKFNGRYFYKPARFGLAGASGPRAEGAALPAGGTQDRDDIQIQSRYHYGVIEISGPAMAASQGDKGSFKEGLADAMDSMYDEFMLIAGIMVIGHGTGVMGVVSSVAGNVITLVDNILPPNWFQENFKIDSYQSDESTLRQAGMKITDVDLDGLKITVDAAGTTAATDRLYLASAKDQFFHGLLAGVDDGNYVGTYININRNAAGRKKFKSYVNYRSAFTKYGDTTRRTLTTSLLQKTLDQQRVRAGSRRAVDLFYSSLGVRRAYFEALSPDRQFNNEIYDGGWQQLKYSNGDRVIPWHADELALKYTLFALHLGVGPNPNRTDAKGRPARPSKIEDEETWATFEVREADWDDATGSQLKQLYSGGNFVDGVGAFLKWYATTATCRPNAHARIDDILES